MKPRRAAVCIVSPALAAANNGNWQTAARWQRFLAPVAGVVIAPAWDGAPVDALIALHARRSADSIARFRAAHAGAPLALVLTGTDLYRDLNSDASARHSLECASHLVVLQDEGLAHLPPGGRAKARSIVQSASKLIRDDASHGHITFVAVGHLRDEKDPLTLMRSARLLPTCWPESATAATPATPAIRIVHIGGALDAALGDEAERTMQACPHYRWLGNLPHTAARRWIARSHALVHMSRMEGGANVVIEAVRSGVPVLASRIDGNVGLLGRDYAGYFETGDAHALTALMRRFASDPAFAARLRAQCGLREPRFTPAAERAAVRALLADMLGDVAHAQPGKPCIARGTPLPPTITPTPTPSGTRPMTDTCTTPAPTPVRLTSFSHGGGCGCKIAPAVLAQILKNSGGGMIPPELMVGIETADDAAVYKLNDTQALIATTDFFMPIVDDPFDFGRIAATNAISDVYAMGGKPIMALALVAMPVNQLPIEAIGQIIAGGESVCRAAGIPIAGGHTIDSVEPIYGLVVMGLVHPDRVRRNADARAGDVLILGKPIGVGVMSAALKKGQLDAAGYRQMVDVTTQLNTPGVPFADMPGVHALTDVTGFGLAGHTLELARGAGVRAVIEWGRVPMLAGVPQLAANGFITGASGRNWDGYGAQVTLVDGLPATARDLLSDPQTSGGLLVSCAPDTVAEVLRVFTDAGFAQAAVIGRIEAGEVGLHVEA